MPLRYPDSERAITTTTGMYSNLAHFPCTWVLAVIYIFLLNSTHSLGYLLHIDFQLEEEKREGKSYGDFSVRQAFILTHSLWRRRGVWTGVDLAG